jgi:hypothetical protein
MSESSSETEPTERARATWEAVAPGWEAARARVFEGFRPVSEWLAVRTTRPGTRRARWVRRGWGYRDGAALGSLTTSTTYRDGTALRNTAHSYHVRAVDNAGNHSDPSNEVVATAT